MTVNDNSEKSSILAKLYSELRESFYPVFVWGAGSMSVEVENRLKEQGVKIEGFFIDGDIQNVHILPREGKIYSLTELENKYDKINVVMGHGHFEKRNLLGAYSFIHKVYIIPNPYLQYRSEGIGKYMEEHKSDIDSILKCLADEKSRSALRAYCRVNETDDIDCLLGGDFCIDGMFGFEKLCLTDSERYLDIGAWEGDTIEMFLQKVSGKYSHITAIEPDSNSLAVLRKRMEGKKNFSYFSCGVGKERGILCIDRSNTQSASLSDKLIVGQETGNKVEVETVDSLFSAEEFSLIKIGIPFMFLDVLQGAEKCIRKNKPRLIVNVAADDGVKVFDTIKWILALKMDYKIALRFDYPMPTRLHLYAC